ncbi:tetranectin [Pelobates cultripes]|uniref:Tetranectin n=1 Tax=Pelobates cultripes TaxID=61616 RepID=A0AAD1RZ86_PELCU|nr:tetranectin [Pelobates cultripes]
MERIQSGAGTQSATDRNLQFLNIVASCAEEGKCGTIYCTNTYFDHACCCHSLSLRFWEKAFFGIWKEFACHLFFIIGVLKKVQEFFELQRAGCTMAYKAVCLFLCVFCFVQITFQQNGKKQRQSSKEVVSMKMFEELKKEIQNIREELDLLKEQQSLQTLCLKGMKTHNKCLLSFSEPKMYHQASDVCIAQGGTLSTPDNGDENDDLYDYVRKSIGPNAEIWIGINDMAKEGNWVDMTGTSITFKHWETEITKQPDGGKQENCASLSAIAIGKWSDKNCKVELPFVCQFTIV